MHFKAPQVLAVSLLLPFTINAQVDQPREPSAFKVPSGFKAEVRDPSIAIRAEEAAVDVRDTVGEAVQEIEARKGGGGGRGGSGGSRYHGGSSTGGDDEGAAGRNGATAGLAVGISALVAAGLLTI